MDRFKKQGRNSERAKHLRKNRSGKWTKQMANSRSRLIAKNDLRIEFKNYMHSPNAMTFNSFLREVRGWSFDQIAFKSTLEKELLFQAGNNVFDNKEVFITWLCSVSQALGYKMPIEFLGKGQVTLIIDELEGCNTG